MGLVYDEHYATSTPSIALEAGCVDFKGLLGVNETSWCGCGGSRSSDLMGSPESCSRVPAGSPGEEAGSLAGG